jgi:catechol 2,3-dioxygenase-like lactoylglutathione lyase family enzyme
VITGVHALFYTPEPAALRAVLRDVLGWEFVEAHEPPDGWQIYALPPAELGVHPSEGSTRHELCFMCDDLAATVAELSARGVHVHGEATDDDFGIWVTIGLPGGVDVLLYEPKHPTAIDRRS